MPEPESIARSRARRAAFAAALALLAACGGDGGPTSARPSSTTGPTVTPAAIAVVSGGGQTGTPGAPLASPFVVRVTTASGAPVVGATVQFQIASGTGTLSPTSALTDANGVASAQLTLGGAAGTAQVIATVAGTTLATTFTATAATTTAAPCTLPDATTLAAGQATTPTGGAACVAGGATGAEYALVAFNTATTALARANVTVVATGTDPVPSVLTNRVATRAALGAPDVGVEFERQLRERTRRELTPLIPDARAAFSRRASSRRVLIPANVQVGQLFRLNANGQDACTNVDMRPARVEAVSSRAIVVSDTTNPTGGFTRADFQSIAATFDTLIDPVDTKSFGQPSDLDANGHVILFYTSSVNALTPRNSGSYVGGFFDSRDLFPLQTANGLRGCAGSNVAEMFYLLVPDPGGQINGNRFSKTFVTRVTLSTVAHEYEHLINSSRRLYVNTQTQAFEETWLDEGLAHIAEELLFYARARLGPRQNVDAATLRGSALATTAFGEDGIANFDRLADYLAQPSRSSPFADDDSLSTRGAAWSFLRYAADQTTPTAQETVWQRLVNSSTTGIANLQQAFGGDVTGLFRDWATMLILDDVAGADVRYQFPSWNLRSIYQMPSVAGAYPLRTVALTSGATSTTSLSGGGAAYLRFAVGAGKAGSVTWNSLPAGITLTLVRLR